jgi:hypothetical protein
MFELFVEVEWLVVVGWFPVVKLLTIYLVSTRKPSQSSMVPDSRKVAGGRMVPDSRKAAGGRMVPDSRW